MFSECFENKWVELHRCIVEWGETLRTILCNRVGVKLRTTICDRIAQMYIEPVGITAVPQ